MYYTTHTETEYKYRTITVEESHYFVTERNRNLKIRNMSQLINGKFLYY